MNRDWSFGNGSPYDLGYKLTNILVLSFYIIVYFKSHLQELLKYRFNLSRGLNFMLALSVRFNLTKTE
jgi:hypothetical protein